MGKNGRKRALMAVVSEYGEREVSAHLTGKGRCLGNALETRTQAEQGEQFAESSAPGLERELQADAIIANELNGTQR
jgi:hypothetical protein